MEDARSSAVGVTTTDGAPAPARPRAAARVLDPARDGGMINIALVSLAIRLADARHQTSALMGIIRNMGGSSFPLQAL